ncbi:MAG: S9 family peptidase, partial [Marinirhabdus sp.]
MKEQNFNGLDKFLSIALLGLFFLGLSPVHAQKKDISLQDIMGGTFRTQGLDALRSLKNGKEYSVLVHDRAANTSKIEVYGYETGERARTLLNSANVPEIDYVMGYEFSADESKLLLSTKLKRLYRRSSEGTFYVYDLSTKKVTKVSDKALQQPTFSPDGSKVAYGYKNNLYIKNLNDGSTQQITADGAKNEIINGITDWVYEEEFGFVRAFDWNSTGDKLAYIKFDESGVPRFSMDVFGTALYPSQQVFKYPKAGDPNAVVSLHLYDVSTKNSQEVNLGAYENYYLPRIKWTQDPNVLSVQATNRLQNTIDLVFVNAATNTSQLILKEKDGAYVDVTDNLTFLENNSFIWTSEKSGWNHIYHYDKTGGLINQITNGPWEVTRYYGFDEGSGRVHYQSSERGSTVRDVYSIQKNGKGKKRLTEGLGTNSAAFSADHTYFINTFHNTTTPYLFTLHHAKDGKPLREIKNNSAVKQTLAGFKLSPKEFSTINVNGAELNMYTIKPLGFDPTKTYPLFMYQYSGPGSQNVSQSWNRANDYWHQMLAQQGIVVVCVDGRGTGLKGRDFKKITQKELGKLEVEDQVAVAKKLGALDYIDAGRIGIWGWSYGGFMSSNCLFQAADTFSMAIAVAPVTSWRFYDTIYTERYMTTPQENAPGYDNNSPISHVDKLKGDYLLVHGSADDNVHVQNTMRLVEALVQANKQFDWAIYPDKNHGIYGGNTRMHLYTKMTDFVL